MNNNLQRKDHRSRKNPHMAEQYQKRRHEQNAARPRQVFNPETKEWTR